MVRFEPLTFDLFINNINIELSRLLTPTGTINRIYVDDWAIRARTYYVYIPDAHGSNTQAHTGPKVTPSHVRYVRTRYHINYRWH